MRILEAGLDSPDAKEINYLKLFKILPEMVESFVSSEKILDIRILAIKLFLKIIRNFTFHEDEEEIIVKPIITWLQIAELNFSFVSVPMLEILS